MTKREPKRQRGRPSRRRSHRTVDVPEGFLVVGQIVGAHGIRGEVKVDLYTDYPAERFAPGQAVLVSEAMEPIEVVSARPHKGRFLVQFAGSETREDAESFRGEWIFIPEEAAVALEEDTYFVHQIVGLVVQTSEGRQLGTVADVIFTGANEVYVVQPETGINRDRDLLIPAIADVVQDVDLEQGLLTVDLLPGMLEEP